ncbi:MAG: hypothetical protein IH614_15055, partial [Desulfuromonadales bacterium]|nr:hypothetical protein [Desulfuromonadales bacterium]
PDPGHLPASALHFGSGVEGGGPDSELLREFELLQELELLLALEGLG